MTQSEVKEDHLLILNSENKILQQKLHSKSEALLILSKELQRVRNECDDYKKLTDSLQKKCSTYKSTSLAFYPQDSMFGKTLNDLKAENKKLANQRERLKTLLTDREEDIKAIRLQFARQSLEFKVAGNQVQQEACNIEIIERMENLKIKYDRIKKDLEGLIDEKQDLVQERDAYKCKVHRLNHAFMALLKTEGYKTIDIDWILSENIYLKESLAQLKEEKQHANEMGKRYKSALEKSHIGKLASVVENSNESTKGEKELIRLMKETSFPCPLQYDLKSTTSLIELCTAALETVNDRMLQLKHQRKANKLIAMKLKEMETKILEKEQIGDLILHPSEFLMRNYSAAYVDQGNDVSMELITSRISKFKDNTSTLVSGSRTSTSTRQSVSSSSSDLAVQLSEEVPLVDCSDQSISKQIMVSNPPDIIAQGLPKQEEDEDAIVLPDHLRDLIEQAKRALDEQAAS